MRARGLGGCVFALSVPLPGVALVALRTVFRALCDRSIFPAVLADLRGSVVILLIAPHTLRTVFCTFCNWLVLSAILADFCGSFVAFLALRSFFRTPVNRSILSAVLADLGRNSVFLSVAIAALRPVLCTCINSPVLPAILTSFFGTSVDVASCTRPLAILSALAYRLARLATFLTDFGSHAVHSGMTHFTRFRTKTPFKV